MSTHIKFVEKVKKAAEAISIFPNLFSSQTSRGMDRNQPEMDKIIENSVEKSEALIWYCLEKMGILKDEENTHSLIAEGFCKEGDARKEFCESMPSIRFNDEHNSAFLPVPWFRKMWAVLSDGKPTETSSGTEVGAIAELIAGNRPASQWSDKVLIEAYSPDCSGEILDELKKRADDKAIIAFEDESAGTVNVDITVELLRQSRRRNTPKIYKKDGKVYKLYVVGDFPSEIYEESPFSPGTLLYNGSCDDCGIDFTGVSKEARQFLRVVYNEGVTPKKSDRMAMLGLVTAAKSGIDELKKIFPEVGIVYDDLAKTDELPSLKSVNAKQNKVNSDPFGGNGNKRT